MKRMIVALGLTLAGAGIVAGFATPANATNFPPPPWVHWKDLPDPAACNSAGVYFEQQGTIKDFFCDEVEPPSADAGGDTILFVIFLTPGRPGHTLAARSVRTGNKEPDQD